MADTTTPAAPGGHAARRGPEPPDIFEKGGMKDGQPQRLNQRLFMQFLAFGGSQDSPTLATAMKNAGLPGVVYEDVNDPRGVGLLTFSAWSSPNTARSACRTAPPTSRTTSASTAAASTRKTTTSSSG